MGDVLVCQSEASSELLPLTAHNAGYMSPVFNHVLYLFDAMFGCTHWGNPQCLRGVSTLLDCAHDKTQLHQPNPVLLKDILYSTNNRLAEFASP